MARITIDDVVNGRDKAMIKEVERLKTFADWQFKDGPCVKEAVAKAGFYHVQDGSDTVRCFCCFKELDQWSADDQPWIEHQRKKDCLFARIGKEEKQLTLDELRSIAEQRENNRCLKALEFEKQKWKRVE